VTEREWLSSPGAWHLFEYLVPIGSARKFRLFGTACCRRAWHLFDASAQGVAEIVERYADGEATESELRSAYVATEGMTQNPVPDLIQHHAIRAVQWISSHEFEEAWNCSTEVTKAVRAFARQTGNVEDAVGPEREYQAILLREIFGNPFRPVVFDVNWRTDTALALAKQMYESRNFGAAPILADALQDAGCDAEDILNHLRDPSATHVRGCWALDLVLGKE